MFSVPIGELYKGMLSSGVVPSGEFYKERLSSGVVPSGEFCWRAWPLRPVRWPAGQCRNVFFPKRRTLQGNVVSRCCPKWRTLQRNVVFRCCPKWRILHRNVVFRCCPKWRILLARMTPAACTLTGWPMWKSCAFSFCSSSSQRHRTHLLISCRYRWQQQSPYF